MSEPLIEEAKAKHCQGCRSPAAVECEWGLYEVGGTPIYSPGDKEKKKVLRIEGAEPRSEPMQKAALCQGCSETLWLRCAGAVNAGLMHWIVRKVLVPNQP